MIYDKTDLKRGRIRQFICEGAAFTFFLVSMYMAYAFVTAVQ